MYFIKLTLLRGDHILVNLDKVTSNNEYTKDGTNDDGKYPSIICDVNGEYVVAEKIDDIFDTIQTIQKRNKQ
jgi:uncharacterized protein YlzI (FlbEa/FlbD family)